MKWCHDLPLEPGIMLKLKIFTSWSTWMKLISYFWRSAWVDANLHLFTSLYRPCVLCLWRHRLQHASSCCSTEVYSITTVAPPAALENQSWLKCITVQVSQRGEVATDTGFKTLLYWWWSASSALRERLKQGRSLIWLKTCTLKNISMQDSVGRNVKEGCTHTFLLIHEC